MVFKKSNSDPNTYHRHTKTAKEQAILWQKTARSINDVDTAREEKSDD